MNDTYFQSFTGDFTDFEKIKVISMNDKYFQSLTGDFTEI